MTVKQFMKMAPAVCPVEIYTGNVCLFSGNSVNIPAECLNRNVISFDFKYETLEINTSILM